MKEKGEKIIELNVSNVKISTTISSFENANENFNAIKYVDEEYDINLTSDFEEIVAFFKEITKKRLFFISENEVEDEELGDMDLYEVSFVNCECPENFKRYYNDGFFLIFEGKLLDTNSDIYKNIDFDELWDTAYMKDPGVECFEYTSEFLQNYFLFS